MSTIYLLNPLTGASGAGGANGYPNAMAGGAGGAAYTGAGAGNYVFNETFLTGGNGGSGGSSYKFGYGNGAVGGSGGAGVNLLSGTLTNLLTITGGSGGNGGNGGYLGGNGNGGSGGAGVNLMSGTLLNDDAIIGGNGGQGGANGGNGSHLNTTGGSGGSGGAGVNLVSDTLTIEAAGTIIGGTGGIGGTSLDLGIGGAGGTGGAGIDLSSSSVLTVTGTGAIGGGTGGNGSYGFSAGNGGSGGVGVAVSSLSSANLGASHVTGGTGGNGGANGAFLGNGGSGGAGVYLNGGSLTTSGTVTGGGGGNGANNPTAGGNGGNGGAGVYLNGGTLTTSGTISGGAGGTGGTGNGAQNHGASGAAGDAVQFGAVASTLVVDPGAVFNGQVAANVSVNDALQFSGVQSGGTGITLGTQFTGFSTLEFDHGAQWKVAVTGYAQYPGIAIEGFTTAGNTIDITNIAPGQVAADFNSTTQVLTSSDGDFHFISSLTDQYFVFNGDGGAGTDVTIAAGDGISSTLTGTVTLGSTAHPSPLTITGTGLVEPTAGGAIGVLSDVAGNILINNGWIVGAMGKSGTAGGAGGVGVDFKLAGTVTNTGQIGGGVGGTGSTGVAGVGGAGVVLLAGTLTNTGSIFGGTGGHSTAGPGGAGGAGVSLSGATLTTSGTISGGDAGRGTTPGAVGDAVKFGAVESTLIVDPGAVFNGAIGGFQSGDTIDITNLSPAQVAQDFNPATHVLGTASDGTLNFAGTFKGEYFVFNNDGGGSGTDITLATGDGISTTLAGSVTLGAAAHPSPLTITNTGAVTPSTAGAVGVISAIAANALTNDGVIQGGSGTNGTTGGTGGAGASFSAGTLTNNGSFANGSGHITGGAGGTGTATGGAGGSGILLNGGTVITSGTISGGQGGAGPTGGAAGDAVKFGAVASTLEVLPGAVFNGQVIANATVNDVLEVSGPQGPGTAITLGTQFVNFSTLEFAAGARRTVDATKADLTAHPLTIDGFALGDTLDITNLASTATTSSFNSATDVLTITRGATAIHLQFDSAFGGDHFALTANGAGTDVTLQSGPAAILAAGRNLMNVGTAAIPVRESPVREILTGLGKDALNFVSDFHRGLIGAGPMPSHDPGSSVPFPWIGAAPEGTDIGMGFESHAKFDHGLLHTAFGAWKA